MNAPEAYEAWFATPFGRRAERVERRILGGLLKDLRPAKRLLDVGCGTGYFAELWQDLGIKAAGVDIWRDALKFCRTRHPGLEVAEADARRLPFRDRAFDVAALVTVLEFVTPPEAALAEAARVAQRGLLLGVLNRASPVALWRRLRRSRAYARARFHTPWGLERLVRSALAGRRLTIHRKTGLYPIATLDGLTALPFGAFIGMSVRFQ